MANGVAGARRARRAPTPSPGATASSRSTTTERALFTAEVSESTVVRPGERFRLVLDPRRFHTFDPASGERLTDRALAATA